MEENKQGMYILAIVAIIAIVGLVVMISGAKKSTTSSSNNDVAGQAYAEDLSKAMYEEESIITDGREMENFREVKDSFLSRLNSPIRNYENYYNYRQNLRKSKGEQVLKKISSSPKSQTIIVALDGSGDYDNIQDAINNAHDGDKIFVRCGEYIITQNIWIEKKRNLLIEGENNKCTIVKGVESLYQGFIFWQTMDMNGEPKPELFNVTLRNFGLIFTYEAVTLVGELIPPLIIGTDDYITIEDNVFIAKPIDSNPIYWFRGLVVHVQASNHNTIRNNVFEAIIPPNLPFKVQYITFDQLLLSCKNSQYNTVEKNNFYGNGAYVTTPDSDIFGIVALDGSKYNINHNNFYNAAGIGIISFDCTQMEATITDNDFYGLKDNTVGVFLLGDMDSIDNTFIVRRNNFYKYQKYLISKVSLSYKDIGNYWESNIITAEPSEYRYKIPGSSNAYDYYPALTPFENNNIIS